MALPSQTERSSQSSRAEVSPAGVPKPLIIVASLILAAGGVYGLFKVMSKPATTPPAPPGGGEITMLDVRPGAGEAKTGTGATTAPAASTGVPTAKPADPAPVTIAMGRGEPAGTTPASAGAPPSMTPPASDSGRPAGVDVSRPDLRPQPSISPGAAPEPVPGTTLASANSPTTVRGMIETGERALAGGKPVEARAMLSRALVSPDLAAGDAAMLRDKLTAISNDLLFSAKVDPADGLVESYVVQAGDALERIARKRQLATEWSLIQRINKVEPRALKVGQKLKLVRGPFHAVVHKRDYRMDVFAGSPDEPERWVYVRSFRVGLGAENTTPEGRFVVRSSSKLVNPEWVNPRTGEHFDADDPKNPIGERWIGLDGVGDAAIFKGYGIHGTIDPASIGTQASMGCVRLAAEDVAMVYDLLVPQISTVRIEP